MKLTRDDRDMMAVSAFLTLCIFPIFGAVVIVAIIGEAIFNYCF